MPNLYFTVKTLPTVGFGDQLGTQFSRLYALGSLLGLEYCYSPIIFPRSVEPAWLKTIKKFIFYIRYHIVFSNINNPLFKIIGNIIEMIELYLEGANSIIKNEKLSKYIGLKRKKTRRASYCDIYIDKLIEKGPFTLRHLEEYLNLESRKKGRENTIIRFCWTRNTYNHIPQIDSLCGTASVNHETQAHTFLARQYWEARKYRENRKTERRLKTSSNALVIHIRCGDSAVIDLGSRKFTINGTRIVTDEELKSILSIDGNRIPIEFGIYNKIFNSLSSNFDSDAFQVFIISDGYERSYHNFLRCLLKPNNSIELTDNEKKCFRNMIKTMNSEFKHFDYFNNTHFFIGEIKKNLFASINALADAKIMIWGGGGFAYYTHTLFKHSPSILIHVKNFNDETINIIKQFIVER